MVVKNYDPLERAKSGHHGVVTIIIRPCAGSEPTRTLYAGTIRFHIDSVRPAIYRWRIPAFSACVELFVKGVDEPVKMWNICCTIPAHSILQGSIGLFGQGTSCLFRREGPFGRRTLTALVGVTNAE